MDNPQINNITVALAMTGDEQGMIQYAMHYAEMFNASLTVIHVQDPHAGGMSMMMDAPGNFLKKIFLINWPNVASMMPIVLVFWLLNQNLHRKRLVKPQRMRIFWCWGTVR